MERDIISRLFETKEKKGYSGLGKAGAVRDYSGLTSLDALIEAKVLVDLGKKVPAGLAKVIYLEKSAACDFAKYFSLKGLFSYMTEELVDIICEFHQVCLDVAKLYFDHKVKIPQKIVDRLMSSYYKDKFVDYVTKKQ